MRLIWLLALEGVVAAQTFPPDNSFTPFRCGTQNAFDALHDQPGAVGERDIIGDQAAPAAFRAVDSQYLYLRMRLDTDPAPGGSLRPFAWGYAFDLDADVTDYEALVILDGATAQLQVDRNTTSTTADSPSDPADQPPLSVAPYAQRGRTLAAGGDAFLDLAVAWSELSPLGITPSTQLRVWIGTSTNPDRLDDDIACQDGATGAPTLSGTAPPITTLDPGATTGGTTGGTGGTTGGGTRAFEGGPGCEVAPGASGFGLLVLLLVLVLASRFRNIFNI